MKLEIVQGKIQRKGLLVISSSEKVPILFLKQGLDKNEVAKIKNWAMDKIKILNRNKGVKQNEISF